MRIGILGSLEVASADGGFLAPSTPRGIRMRNWMFNRRVLFGAMTKLTDRFATRIDLPDY